MSVASPPLALAAERRYRWEDMGNFLFFYSWQSDSPNRTNRGFVADALRQAARAVTASADIEEPVRITSDTQGAAGAPDISQAILENIDSSDGFIADVTITLRPEASARVSPNPNVMVETGYAARALTWSRVVMILNTAFGAIEDLPFDLRSRRIITYHFPDSPEIQPSQVKGAFARRLEDALAEIVQLGRHFRGPSDSLKQYWLPEMDSIRGILRDAMLEARAPRPPLYKSTQVGMVPRTDEVNVLRHVTIRDESLRRLALGFAEQCEKVAQHWFLSGKKDGDENRGFGPSIESRVADFERTGGPAHVSELEALYERALERIEELLR